MYPSGTSTNIIVVGLLQSTPEINTLNLFSPVVVGIPIIIFGIIYFALFGNRLCPFEALSQWKVISSILAVCSGYED